MSFYQFTIKKIYKPRCDWVCVCVSAWKIFEPQTKAAEQLHSRWFSWLWHAFQKVSCKCRYLSAIFSQHSTKSKCYDFDEVFLFLFIFSCKHFPCCPLFLSVNASKRVSFSLASCLLTLAQCSIPKLMWNSFLIKTNQKQVLKAIATRF